MYLQCGKTLKAAQVSSLDTSSTLVKGVSGVQTGWIKLGKESIDIKIFQFPRVTCFIYISYRSLLMFLCAFPFTEPPEAGTIFAAAGKDWPSTSNSSPSKTATTPVTVPSACSSETTTTPTKTNTQDTFKFPRLQGNNNTTLQNSNVLSSTIIGETKISISKCKTSHNQPDTLSLDASSLRTSQYGNSPRRMQEQQVSTGINDTDSITVSSVSYPILQQQTPEKTQHHKVQQHQQFTKHPCSPPHLTPCNKSSRAANTCSVLATPLREPSPPLPTITVTRNWCDSAAATSALNNSIGGKHPRTSGTCKSRNENDSTTTSTSITGDGSRQSNVAIDASTSQQDGTPPPATEWSKGQDLETLLCIQDLGPSAQSFRLVSLQLGNKTPLEVGSVA